MTKRYLTKRSLVASLLVLCMCLASFVGTTYAWFTDSVSSSSNVIKTGNLDVQLLMNNGTDYVDISESTKPIFGENGLISEWEGVDVLWEPGKTEIVYLGVKNAGTLGLKYSIVVDVADGGLVGSLEYAIIDGATRADANALGIASWKDIAAADGAVSGLVQNGRTIAAENGALDSMSTDYFALAVHMMETSGNDYQDKDVVININVVATQLSSESDSFGNDYDQSAPLPIPPRVIEVADDTELKAAFESVNDGDVIKMAAGINTSNAPITEAFVVDKEVTLVPNGMYLVSAAASTFTVVEGGKLTIDEGSFTVKNTAANGSCIFVDGGEFEMAGGSFDGYAAVETAHGKSSTVTVSAGWSNRVTVGIKSNGDDVINVTGGTLISSQESIIANGNVTLNMSGGTLSGKPARQNQYNASLVFKGETTINMTGGKIETTANQSIAVNVQDNSSINLSGDAVISGTNAAIRFGDFSGRDLGDNNVLNISGNAKVTANGAGNNWKIGFAIQANATNTVINISGNAVIQGSSYGVLAGQDGCAVNVSDNATVTATSGSEGYGIGAPSITITGGTITAKNYGVISDMANSTVVIDNSETKTPITISGGTYDVYVHSTTDYTCSGDPNFDTFGKRS